MITHYLKVAFRNLWKYRTQNVISILGLAAGFVCFTLSALWIRYELTYDDFHDGADRIYYICTKSDLSEGGLSSITPNPLAGYLKSTYPWVEASCPLQPSASMIEKDGVKEGAHVLYVDSSFLPVFQVKLVEGSWDFLQRSSGKIALTEEYARKRFPAGDALGKKLTINGSEQEISAIVTGWGTHTNLPYDYLRPFSSSWNENWGSSSLSTYIKLRPGTDQKALIRQLEDTPIEQYIHDNLKITIQLKCIPLIKKRYEYPEKWWGIQVQLQHVRWFTLAGGLLIVCALLNYLGVFISQFRIRSREMALRRICGSSVLNLAGLLLTELFVFLGISILLGLALIEILLPSFMELAQIQSSRSAIYAETAVYIGMIIILTTLFSLLPIFQFRKRTLSMNLSTTLIKRGRNDYFRKGCLLVQLIISLGITFCTTVIVKQLHHLTHTDLGIERDHRATVWVQSENVHPVQNCLKEVTQIVRVVDGGFSLLPAPPYSFGNGFTDWPEKPENMKEGISFGVIQATREMIDFYGIKPLRGKIPDFSIGSHGVLINETLARLLQVKEPLGMQLDKEIIIEGIVPDYFVQAPTLPAKPVLFEAPLEELNYNPVALLVEYQGDWNVCKEAILRQLTRKHLPEDVARMESTEEVYNEYIRSERTLQHLLYIVSGVCVWISLFGVYSLVTLSCEQRRKEIAIRKVNGATTREILRMFFQEYLILLGIAALVAFPIGYLIMSSWLDGYVIRTTISIWLYPAILGIVSLFVVATISWRVWKAARQNPAEVIKSN